LIAVISGFCWDCKEVIFNPNDIPGPDPRLDQVIQAVMDLTRQVGQLANQLEELRKKVEG
jgi:hypothetical protein